MLTPAKIQAISDPIEEVYIHIVDELMVNIGKHLTSPTWTHTAAWEIQKLSEMGQLTQENAEIINKWIKQLPKEVRDAMEETRRLALEKIEKDMETAVRLGKLPEPLADSTVNVLNEYSQQAIDQLNLVNTVMLQSSVQQYQRAVQLTKEEYDKLMQQQEQTQIILNEAAGSVATGIETREKALRRAITRISDEGLTGFIDRAGHHWTPEAYVNMDIRTTVHNTAIQSVKNFMTDYNTQVFQVSSHAAARPGCYPYQGKFYSWDNSTGEIELGNGNMVRYEPLNVTTYGQPAGLFGINCGHYPIPIVPGVTIPHGADNIQPKEENDKAYEESQVQRSLERQIREAKRVVEMAGDKASPEMKQKVKDAQEQMRDFIAKTGRTRRYDREKIGGLPKGSGTQTASGGKVNTELTNNKPQPVTVDIGDKIKKSLGNNATEYEDLVKLNPLVAKTYNAYAKDLAEIEQKRNAGVYKSAIRKIEWDYGQGTQKYETLSHEYGHHTDASLRKDIFTTKEIDAINNISAKNGLSNYKIIKSGASSSDQFLTAMRKDRQSLYGYKNNKEDRARMNAELLANSDQTAGIQDAFDGFWGTQSSSVRGFSLPWGHGNKYYNRKYSSVTAMGWEKDLKDVYESLGFDASNQQKVKQITRDYETASELWANIQAAETIGGKELDFMKQYFPSAVGAWEDMVGRI